jgi:transcriptional regulator of arginine metabolism
MRTKAVRLFAIRELIQQGAVVSQDELRRKLSRRGLDVTQATLSRDLQELGALWVNTPEGGHYQLPTDDESPAPRGGIAPFTIHSITSNECLVVVTTMPGGANAIGEFIDHQRSSLILGTVAGDNTLLVIPHSVQQTKDVVRFLKHILLRGNS